MVHPLKNIERYDVVLASNSPRRHRLLGQLGVNFAVRVLEGIDESYPDDLPVDEIAAYISRKKAAVYRETMGENELVITADTVVVCGNMVLGKPQNADDAYSMLRTLSGVTHKVITGVTITGKNVEKTFSSVTEVDFAELTDDEIAYYIDTFKPFDKAGAYGIQEWIGCIGVTGMRGSYYNVMGLPIQKLYRELLTLI
ncbi:MAG: septum formation protein Maf [Muribaculaceae bacterium]|nr:septum formation protein Maf [Muribaculaceae bacterium]